MGLSSCEAAGTYFKTDSFGEVLVVAADGEILEVSMEMSLF